MNKNNISAIDVVIPWVDGNDPEWQRVYRKYVSQSNSLDSNTVSRYRDWDNLQFLFRGIEKFMPWVRTVHLVTCGQKPSWLNLDAPKLNFVRHEDFIPLEYLPTFSVRPIELNIHRIQGLADRFIYFNDDFFVLMPMEPTDFFKNGLPIDIAALDVLQAYSSRALVMANNTIIINNHFNKRDELRKHWNIWFKLSYGHFLIKTISLMRLSFFPAFLDTHLPQPYIKNTFEEVWRFYEHKLMEVSKHRFRDISDVNQSLMRYWQIVSGKIHPANVFKKRTYFLANDNNISSIVNAISAPKQPLLVINDSDEIENFERVKNAVKEAFETLLPQKSSFEL